MFRAGRAKLVNNRNQEEALSFKKPGFGPPVKRRKDSPNVCFAKSSLCVTNNVPENGTEKTSRIQSRASVTESTRYNNRIFILMETFIFQKFQTKQKQ